MFCEDFFSTCCNFSLQPLLNATHGLVSVRNSKPIGTHTYMSDKYASDFFKLYGDGAIKDTSTSTNAWHSEALP